MNTPLRTHPQFGNVDYATFGRMLMQASPIQQGQDMAKVVSEQWRNLPVVVPADATALVPHGTEPDLADRGVSYPVDRVQSRIEQLRQSSELGGSRSQANRTPLQLPHALGAQHLPPGHQGVRLQTTTRRDILRSLSCNRRSVSVPRTHAGGLDAPEVASVSARGVVDAIQSKAHELTVTAAAVAAPVVLAGGTVVTGGIVGGMVGQEMAGEMAASSLGEWARPGAQMIGKAMGAVSGTTMTNTAMSLASSCQRRAPPPSPRIQRAESTEYFAMTGDEADAEGLAGADPNTRSHASRSNMSREELDSLKSELSKLHDLDQHPVRRRRSRSGGGSLHQDAIEDRFNSMQQMMEQRTQQLLEQQQKQMLNLLSPLTAEISGKFAEQSQLIDGLRDEVQREGREARRKIRAFESDLECISQQLPAGDDYNEEEQQDDAEDSEVVLQVRGDPLRGEVTYDDLVEAIKASNPACSINYINEHWSMLPVITDGQVTMIAGEAREGDRSSGSERPMASIPGQSDALPTERPLFSPGPAPQLQQQSSPTGTILGPTATTYVTAMPSFDPTGGVAQFQVPGPHAGPAGQQAPYVKLPLNSTEVARRELVRKTLVAAQSESQDEQLQKTVERIPNFPTCSDATELEDFLTKVVDGIRTVSKDPDLMARWIREASITASVGTPEAYDEWFDHLGHSGKGFVRTDILLLMQIKSAVKRAAHLHNRIGVKQLEFTKKGCDLRGRQALLMVREHFKESSTDREHTDRRRIDAVCLQGDNIEGYWDKFCLTLSELDPKNVPSDSYLLDAVLMEMRKSRRFQNQINVWDQLLPEYQKTFKQLEFMIVDFMKREQQLKTSQQIRGQTDQSRAGARTTPAQGDTAKKNSICNTWKTKGYCNRGDDCAWKHPGDARFQRPAPKAKSKGKTKGRGKGKPGGKDSRSSSLDSKRSVNSNGKPRSSKDPKLVCMAYLKGKCKKSDAECPKVHNPTCYFYKSNKKCELGDQCLFPHHHGGGAHASVESTTETSPPATEGAGGPAAKAKAKAKARAKSKPRAGGKANAIIAADGD